MPAGSVSLAEVNQADATKRSNHTITLLPLSLSDEELVRPVRGLHRGVVVGCLTEGERQNRGAAMSIRRAIPTFLQWERTPLHYPTTRAAPLVAL